MFLLSKRSKRESAPRQPQPRLAVEELSHRLMLSGDGTIDPPCPPPPSAHAETIQFE